MIRKSFLKPSSLPRRSAAKKKRRSKTEFARIYGSKERVLFVKGLPCCACGVVGYSEDAHVPPKGEAGTGYKADYRFISPLCKSHYEATGATRPHLFAGCHAVLHHQGRASLERYWGIDLEKCAEETEKLWLAYQEENQ